MKKPVFVTLLAVVLGFSTFVHAALIDNGGGLIYDTDLNITWYNATYGPTYWSEAMAWAAGLNVGGVTGWRLPTTPNNLTPAEPYSTINQGEMGYLYYVEGINGGSPGPFSFLTEPGGWSTIGFFWSGTTGPDYNGGPSAYGFNFGPNSAAWGGYGFLLNKVSYPARGWAVHDGNISPSAGFTQSDLAGTWYFQVIGDYTSVNAPIWVSGTMTVNATGAITGGTTIDSKGQAETVTGGTLTIDSAGQVSGTLIHSGVTETLPHGKLDASKTRLDLVMSNTDGRALFVGIKGGGTFTQADLVGTWYFQVIGDYTSANAPIWVSGTMTVNATGAITGGTTIDSKGQAETVTGGTLTIDSAGQVSGTLIHSGVTETLPHGKLDASKTRLDLVMSNTDGRALFVGIKGGGTFTQADLVGTWYFQVYGDSPSANRPYWGSGTMNVNAAGNITGGTAVNDSGVVKTLTGGSLTIDSLGQVTGTVALSDGTTESLPYGKLDPTKTVLTMVNSDSAYRALLVAFSAGASCPVNGQCGSADGGTFTSAPSSNLCSAGTASTVGGNGPWTWSCAGSSGGTTANCQANANIQTWTVTPSAGSNGTISPNTPQTVNHAATTSFTITPNAGYSASVGGTCGGTLSGTTYTTLPITASCSVTATFTWPGSCTMPPGPITPLTPSGTVIICPPTLTWPAVPCASWYQLWCNDSSGPIIKQWYTAAQTGCPSGTGTCHVTPPFALPNGAYQCWIQTWDDAGYGPWGNPTSFAMQCGDTCSTPPGAVTLTSPSDIITTNTPTYTWNAVPCASWYYLWVDDSTSPNGKVKQWYTAAQAGCPSGTGTCSVTPSVALATGSGEWWIQTWDDAGYGPWSAGMNFTVSGGNCTAVPPAVNLVSPSGVIATRTPTYNWNAVPCASWYYLWVNDTVGIRIQQWYTAAQAGCASGTGTCSATPAIGLNNGGYQWWIETWDDAGYGPWSAGMNFSVSP